MSCTRGYSQSLDYRVELAVLVSCPGVGRGEGEVRKIIVLDGVESE